ncbi:beta strand repeat-containing protein [Paludisphaera borealis]|uniref:PKD domain-containing protein n=1 Tax=Paludisphaera borealis TaxID=1387353 RepID=A0A1U7CSE4_9BACT|nr:hypothetical protein [Paludisphaera borealis]APW61857.1 hypothetical protein BSF38_03387 [Paludisphaera borealis]
MSRFRHNRVRTARRGVTTKFGRDHRLRFSVCVETLETRITPVVGLGPIRDNLTALLNAYQNQILKSEVYAVSLPAIGTALSSRPAFQFAGAFATSVQNNLAAAGTLDQVKVGLATAFGVPKSAIHVNDTGNPDDDDITTDAQVAAASKVEFFVTKTGSLGPVAVPFDLGTSLKNLNLGATSGAVNVGLDYTLPLRFGIDGGMTGSNFFVDVSGTSDLTVTPTVGFGSLSLTGTLGALGITATNAGSSLTAPFNVDIAGTRLGTDFSSINATASLPADAAFHLRLAITAGGGTALAPRITTQLNVDWSLADSNVNGTLLGGVPTVEFANINVDAGSVARSLIAPYLNEVEKVLQPIQKLSDVLLDRPIPQIPIDYLDMIEFVTRLDTSDTSDTTLTGLLNAFQSSPSDLRLFLEKAKAVGALLTQLQNSNGILFPIGSFKADVDVRQSAFSLPSDLANSLPKNASSAQAFKGIQTTLNQFSVSKGTFQAAVHVNLLEDTSNVAKLLLGDPTAKLVSFDLGVSAGLSGGYSFTTLVGIVPVQFNLTGRLDVSAFFDLGYDATGLVKYAKSKNGADLVKGLYVGADTHLSFTPSVTFEIKGGFDDSTILGLIRSYTGVSVPGWVVDLSGFKPELTVAGRVKVGVDVTFAVAGASGPNSVVHVDQFPGGNVASALTTTGTLTLDASADFNYGIHAELPGRKVFNKLGLGKVVGGASFNVGGSIPLINPSIHLATQIFPTTSNLSNLKDAAPTPPVVAITVGGAAKLGAPDAWIINEGATASLNATASTPTNDSRFTYNWKQLTAADMGGIVFSTPSVKLSDAQAQSPTFKPNKYSLKDNPDVVQDPGFSLVGWDDRYIFEVTVTDQDTGLSSKRIVYVVAQDVSPTVAAPKTQINGVSTIGVGVRGFDLGFGSNFTDPGTQERFDATWNFGDPTGVNNVIGLPTGGGPNGIRPGNVGAIHQFSNSGTYTVGLTVRDGFTENSISKTRGTTLATSTISIVAAAVLPDQADASKLALYVGGSNQSETIILGYNPVTKKITVSMPDFSGEFDPTNVAHIYVNGQGGDDVILFDFSNGNFVPGPYERTDQQLGSDGVTFTTITYIDSGGAIIDGGAGNNRYQAIGGDFDSVEAAFLPDANGMYQNGFVNYLPTPDSPGILVNFLHVQSIYELSGAKQLLLAGNPDADQFTIRDGVTVGTTATTEILDGPAGERGSLTFANKPLVIVAGGAGADTFIVDNPNPAAGLTKLVLDGYGVPAQDAQGNDLPDDGAADVFYIRAIGVDVEALGGGGDDVFNISSTAGINDRGNLDGIRGNVTIDAGTGNANLLYVVDYSSAAGNPNVVVTDSTITGLAPGTITYRATGGSFANDVDGIVLVGSFAWADQFNIRSTLAGSRTLILGLGGDDVFYISSNAPGQSGDLAGIQGVLTIDGGYGHYLDGTAESNLRGLYSRDTIIVEGDADFTLSDTLNRLADGSPTPDRTASEAVLSVTLAGNRGIVVPDIRLISIESAHLIGGASANRMDGSGFSGNLVLEGMGGNDTLIGGWGDNELDGGDGDNDLYAGGDLFATPGLGSQNHVVLGGGGTNVLRGGGTGRNTFHVGLNGTATLIGGDGDDTFIITNPTGAVTAPVGGITIDGGGQAGDTLILVGGGGPSYNQTYLIGPAPGQGAIVTSSNNNPTGLTISQFIRYTGLAAIFDSITADKLNVLGASEAAPIAGASAADLTAGLLHLTAGGSPSAAITFANKTSPSVLLPGGQVVRPLPLVESLPLILPIASAVAPTPLAVEAAPPSAATVSVPALTAAIPAESVPASSVAEVVTNQAPPIRGRAIVQRLAARRPFVAKRPAVRPAPVRPTTSAHGPAKRLSLQAPARRAAVHRGPLAHSWRA